MDAPRLPGRTQESEKRFESLTQSLIGLIPQAYEETAPPLFCEFAQKIEARPYQLG